MSRALLAPASSPRLVLLRWAAGVGAVTAQSLAERDGGSLASARARLVCARRAGQMAATRPLQDTPTLFTLTRAGLVAAGAEQLAAASVSASGARHAAACGLAAARLQRGYDGHRVLGEPALRLLERQRGRPFAVCGGGPYAGAGHRPDLLLVPLSAGRRPIAVEVELTVKSPRRLGSICRAWARSREVEGALYLAGPGVHAPLMGAIEAVRAGARIAVVALDALAFPDACEQGSERTVSGDA